MGPDGRNYDIHDFPFTDMDGSSLILEMGIDITERKQSEEELRRHKEHLEDLVRERTAELGTRNAQLAAEIAEHRRTEDDLRESEARYRALFDNMTEGFALHEIITDENGRPCDYRFLSINPSFERLTGLKRADLLGKRVLEVLPDNDPHWIEAYGKVALTGEPMCFENFATPLNRWYEVFAYSPALRQFAVIFMDITARKKAQLALEAAILEAENERRRLEAVMDALPVGVVITDAHGGSIKSNIAYEQIWGGPRPVTQSVRDYGAYKAWWADTGKPVEPEEWASAQAVGKGLTVVDQIMEIEAFDGERRFVMNGAAPVKDTGGTIVGSAVTIQDITSLRRAEQALRQREEDLNFAQAVAHTGSWRLDVRRNELLWSDENHRIFGVPNGTPLTYETFLDIVHPEDQEYVDREWTAALRGAHYDIEHRIVVGGTVKWVRERAELEFDKAGALLGGFGTTQDITERKQAEEALRKAHDELEIRVQERTEELERRNKELQEFVFVASHDLREPLRKIQTFGDLVARKPADALTDAGRDYLSRMQRAAARMQKLLESLLGYSRVTTHAEPFQDTDLSKSVEVALSNLEMVVTEKKARFEVGQLPTLQADRVQMIQLFQNLISNALKFQGGDHIPHVKIYAKAIEKKFGRRNAYEICVEDNGIGFDEQYVDKIFKPFQRLHGREEYEGVGIGLAICRKIVERHGGTITARSTVGQGSTFIITLPVRQGAKGR
jgi:hypothetical protein